MPRALRDLEAIHAHISKDSVANADRVAERLIDRLDQIAEFPGSGRRVPEYGVDHIREVIEPPYRVIYRVKKEAIEIAAIVHSSRKLRFR